MQIMHQSAITLLLPGYRRSVLALLLLKPDEALHAREVSRRVGLPAGTVIRELKRLAQVGLLNCEKRGNQLLYSANRSAAIFEELASILRKTLGLADVLIGALAPLSNRIEVAFIFGSVARAAERSGSDVDVLVIGAIGFGEVVDALYPAQKQIGREINPKVFSPQEWRAKLKDENAFVLDVLSKPKIFLIGGENELAKSARDKP